MVTGIRIRGSSDFRLTNCSFGGVDVAVDVSDSSEGLIQGFHADLRPASDHLKLYGKEAGRNKPCPCGSGLKTKKCTGVSSMSTGIRSKNSTLSVGKATIFADVGVDLEDSTAHIEELNHYSPYTPKLVEILQQLPAQPPEQLIREAIAQLKSGESIESLEGSKLRQWFRDQGINAAFWSQLAVGLASIG